MPSRAFGGAPAALLLLACVTMVMATQASAAATWKVELVPTPITRDAYEATTTLPATCFKISQTGKCGASRCCCDAPPPSMLTIKNVARACARTNKPPAFTVDGIAQDGAKSARYFGKGAAKLSGANSNLPSLALTLPAWATGQTERVVCISTGTGACGTLAKISGNRATASMTLSGTGSCSKTSKCMSAATSIKTAPLATAVHAIVVEYANVANSCTPGLISAFSEFELAFEQDARALLVSEVGAKAAKSVTTIFRAEFCSAVPDEDGKPTGRVGIVGWAWFTGPPDLVDNVLKMLDKDEAPAPASTAVACRELGGDGCVKHAADHAATYAGSAKTLAAADSVAYSPLLSSLQTYLASGFNILKYDPTGALSSQQTTKLDVSNWILPGKVYDLNSVAAACANDGCFSSASSCASSLSTTNTASTTERQDEVFASVQASGEYLGVTASASASFRNAQKQIESSDVLSILTMADCNILTFNLPFGGPVQFSSDFVSAVTTSLNAITAARDPNTDAGVAAEGLVNAFSSIYNNYGTHIPLSIGYGGYMRLELLMKTESLASTFKKESELNAAFSHAVADLSASGGATSDEAKKLFSSTSSWSFLTIPQIPSVSLTPIGTGGYQINPTNWTSNLSAVDKSTLYPRVISTKSLAQLFHEAAGPGSPTAQQFGAIASAAMAQMDVLARAYLAYVINDSSQWPAELAGRMPQLLQNPNYLVNGQCVNSPLIVRVNKNPDAQYDAAFRCITCVRDVQTLPSDPTVSVANPDNTASCTVGSDFSLASVKPKCNPCRGCQGQGPMCPPAPADPNADWGAWNTPAKCDGCVQCVSESNCNQNNNNQGFYGGYGDGGPAKCTQGRCVQCLSSDNCHHNGPCSTADNRYVCT